jgi:hypothetical protein
LEKGGALWHTPEMNYIKNLENPYIISLCSGLPCFSWPGNGHPFLYPPGRLNTLLGIDDREDTLSRFCLTTATYTIARHYKRRLLRRKNADYLLLYGEYNGEYIFSLREYPIRKVLTVHANTTGTVQWEEPLFGQKTLLKASITVAFPMRVSVKIFLSRWFCGIRTGLHGRKKWE